MWRRIGLSIASSNAVSEIEGGPVEHFVRLRGCMAFAPLRYAVLLQVGVSNIVSPTNTTQRCIAYRESQAIVVNFDRISARKGSPGPIDVEISQETLAEMIETTRSRVNFFMNKFCKNQAAFNRFSKQVARLILYLPMYRLNATIYRIAPALIRDAFEARRICCSAVPVVLRNFRIGT
jgi:hypothetical protein